MAQAAQAVQADAVHAAQAVAAAPVTTAPLPTPLEVRGDPIASRLPRTVPPMVVHGCTCDMRRCPPLTSHLTGVVAAAWKPGKGCVTRTAVSGPNLPLFECVLHCCCSDADNDNPTTRMDAAGTARAAGSAQGGASGAVAVALRSPAGPACTARHAHAGAHGRLSAAR